MGESVILSASNAPTRAYVAFAGGGAKGLVHVGGLHALEQKVQSGDLTIKGYAGTSAGALIACLAAAGISAEQMVDLNGRGTLIDLIKNTVPDIRKLTDLFGFGGWASISSLRWIVSVATGVPSIALILLLGTAGFLIFYSATMAESWFGLAGQIAVALSGLAFVAAVVYLGRGLVRLTVLHDALRRCLKAWVFGSKDWPDDVRFCHFSGDDAIGWSMPLLKIVASDISNRKLQLFSCDTTPQTSVADAVCASVCIPFIFAPWQIDGLRFVDGGVVSNFPAWPFDEEKGLDPDAMTIGFQIGEPDLAARETASPVGPVFWPLAAIQTALLGARQLSVRAVGRAELITLPARMGPLDFDLNATRVCKEVVDVTKFAVNELDDRLLKFPSIYHDACVQVRTEMIAVLGQQRPPAMERAALSWVRCAVAMRPAGSAHSLVTRYGAGYDTFADSDLPWPLVGSLAGAAWSSREPRFELNPVAANKELWRPENLGLRRRLPPDLAWSLRVPMSTSKNTPFLVVMVDGSDSLKDTPSIALMIEAVIDRVQDIFRPVVSRFEETLVNGEIL